MRFLGLGKEDKEKAYLCFKYPTLDLVIKPHPTKDREGKIISEGHHAQFKDGRFATSDEAEISFIESHQLFQSGIIVDEHVHKANEFASKKAKLDKEAETLGFRLVKL